MYSSSSTAFTSRLVDGSADASVVYALYPHEMLGTVLGAFVVAHTEAGSLSLRYQRLLPENADAFMHLLDDQDRVLVELLGEFSPHRLLKRFGDKGATMAKFQKKFSAKPYSEVLEEFARLQLATAYPLLRGKALYASANDGYPADTLLTLLEEPATLQFFFERSTEGTQYHVEVYADNRRLHLHETPGDVLVTQPAWIRSGNLVFAFEGNVDGRKLKPFFAKEHIRIAPKYEQEYYEKFLTKLLEEHEVTLSGFELQEAKPAPVFALQLHRDNQSIYTLRLRVRYDTAMLVPGKGSAAPVRVISKGGAIRFQKIVRQMAREKEISVQIQGLLPQPDALLETTLSEPETYEWLCDNAERTKEIGVEIEQWYTGPMLHVGGHNLRYVSEQVDGVVFATPLVEAGGYTQPLEKHFEKLRSEQRHPLTTLDGERFFLRAEEHLTLRHLLEVGTVEGGKLRLSPAQAAILPPDAGVYTPFTTTDKLPEAKLPKDLQATLRPYQKAGYDWLVFLSEHHMGGILADDMGLGKTLQALALLLRHHTRPTKQPSLVVVPNSLIFNWLQEAERFTPSLKLHVYAGSKRERTESTLFRYDILLTTYGMVRQDIARLAKLQFEYIVLDESQYIKNRDAKTTQAVLKLRANYRVSLTGTPIENTTMELWTQFQFLNPGLLGGRTFFENHYTIPIEKYQDERRARRLKALVRPFLLRRTKGQVAPELPELVEQVRYCTLSDTQANLYEQERQQLHASLHSEALSSEEGFEKAKFQILSSLQRLRQIAIHPQLLDETQTDVGGKHEALWDHLEDILAEGSKVLVFSQFVKLLTIIKKEFKERGIRYSYLDGQTKDRAAAVENFQEDPEIQVFLISLKAGGVGLNLTAAEYVLMLDPWWNPAVEAQAIARAHRIGQQKTVFAYKFISQGTIEESILEMQERKSRVANEIIQNEEQFFKKLTRAELLSLLERPRQAATE